MTITVHAHLDTMDDTAKVLGRDSSISFSEPAIVLISGKDTLLSVNLVPRAFLAFKLAAAKRIVGSGNEIGYSIKIVRPPVYGSS